MYAIRFCVRLARPLSLFLSMITRVEEEDDIGSISLSIEPAVAANSLQFFQMPLLLRRKKKYTGGRLTRGGVSPGKGVTLSRPTFFVVLVVIALSVEFARYVLLRRLGN